MAKHAKRRKAKTGRRRRRIGATAALNPSSPLVKYGSIALGFFLGDKIDAALTKVIPTNVDAKLIAGAELGLGAFLVFKKGGRASLLKSVAGGLLLGAGAKKAMGAFGIGSMGGYQMIPAVGGYGQIPALGAPARRIAGYMPNHGLTGYPVTKQGINGVGLMDSSMID